MWRRPILVLAFVLPALTLLPTLAPDAKPARKATPEEREARGFLEIITAVLQPLRTVANQAAWTAATDVTAEHTAARAAAEKALAGATGAKLVIEKTRALLKQEAALDPLSARQLKKLLLAAADSPATVPEVVAQRIEAEARQSAVLDGYTFCLLPGRAGCARPISANDLDDILRKSRNLRGARAGLDGQQGDRSQAQARARRAARPAQPGGAGHGLSLVLRPAGRGLRHDRARDDGAHG